MIRVRTGTDSLVEIGGPHELDSQVNPCADGDVVAFEGVLDYGWDFEKNYVELGFVLLAVVVVFEVVVGFVAVAEVAELEPYRDRQFGNPDFCLCDNSARGFVSEPPVFRSFTKEEGIEATAEPETERESVGKSFAACTAELCVLVGVALIGVVIVVIVPADGLVVLAFGKERVCRGAVFFVAVVFGFFPFGGSDSLGLGGRVLFWCGRGGCCGFCPVTAVPDAGGSLFVASVVQFCATSVLGGNPCGVDFCRVFILREGGADYPRKDDGGKYPKQFHILNL